MLKKLVLRVLSKLPFVSKFVLTRETQTPLRIKMWFIQKVLGFNSQCYWPVHHSSLVSSPNKIFIGVETCPGYMPGCYVQGGGGIVIGDYTQISCNVGLISRNHDLYDVRRHKFQDCPSIVIGKYCWIGMNATVLPGVELGDHTVVGAGSVVTKSFPDGYCVVAGSPARVIRYLEKEKCIEFTSKHEYYGYIKKANFENFKRRHLRL